MIPDQLRLTVSLPQLLQEIKSRETFVQFVGRFQLKMATCGLKQESVLLYQDVEQSPYQRDFAMSGKFLHFLQSENIGSPDGDPIIYFGHYTYQMISFQKGFLVILNPSFLIFNKSHETFGVCRMDTMIMHTVVIELI